MKEVGANSDIHWVLFDEENRAIGFMRIHKVFSFYCISECIDGVRIYIWYGWKAYSIYYNVHE